jgi:omega-6 fatty acid desaturase (delta-12 desaturase)
VELVAKVKRLEIRGATGATAFAVEDPAKTRRLFLALIVAIAVAQAATFALSPWPLKLAGSILLGLLNVRLFIFFHDGLHGAIFRRSRLGKIAMSAVGHYMLSPPSYWKFSHNRHHAHNGELAGSFIGELPLVDVETWRSMSAWNRFAYRATRSPTNLVLAYATIFIGTQCVYALARDPRRHRAAAFTLIAHFGGLAAIGHALGWEAALFNGLLPIAIAHTVGAALFYIQHNAPYLRFAGRGSRDRAFAALNSTTMLDMPPLMHWFTGNIGYHHVHHVNPGIPFYRLPEAMAALAELQRPVRITWSDLPKCLAVGLWDPVEARMVGYRLGDHDPDR